MGSTLLSCLLPALLITVRPGPDLFAGLPRRGPDRATASTRTPILGRMDLLTLNFGNLPAVFSVVDPVVRLGDTVSAWVQSLMGFRWA